MTDKLELETEAAAQRRISISGIKEQSCFPHVGINDPFKWPTPPFVPVTLPGYDSVGIADTINVPKVEAKPVVPVADPAHTFLEEGAKAMSARAQLRDKPQGERSMESIVKTFNALTGHNLTEAEGWEFMILLKMVRGRQGKYNKDDYVDGAAYFGLLGECESTRYR
jgi:hypothetical protein